MVGIDNKYDEIPNDIDVFVEISKFHANLSKHTSRLEKYTSARAIYDLTSNLSGYTNAQSVYTATYSVDRKMPPSNEHLPPELVEIQIDISCYTYPLAKHYSETLYVYNTYIYHLYRL